METTATYTVKFGKNEVVEVIQQIIDETISEKLPKKVTEATMHDGWCDVKLGSGLTIDSIALNRDAVITRCGLRVLKSLGLNNKPKIKCEPAHVTSGSLIDGQEAGIVFKVTDYKDQ